jgi:SET domain-containing protein
MRMLVLRQSQNHACNPNLEVIMTSRGENGTLPGIAFRSIVDIQAGEELTVAYYDMNDLVSITHG